jgi:DNA polymerase-1
MLWVPPAHDIPSNNKLRKLRTCVVAPEGRRLVSAGYSQIELRIAARIAGEEAMLEAFRQNIDIHARTVKPILGTEDDMKDGRKLTKGLNFRLLYGMGPKLLRN